MRCLVDGSSSSVRTLDEHAPDEHAASSRAGVPSRIGRYAIAGLLGSGAMAVVYLARDAALARDVALKVIKNRADERAAARLVREGQALARIDHPNVIRVHEVAREGELLYVAMERVVGLTLDDWLATPRDHAAILDAFVQAARGLAAAHAAGIVHRDFKPANVMVGADGRVRVLDFGLARALESDDSAPASRESEHTEGAVLGTPAFMAPEQWRGQRADERADQFSFCVALAGALGGQHPFPHRSRGELRDAVLDGKLVLPAAIPRHIARTLARGLALDPSARFPSMESLLHRLVPARRRRPAIIAAATFALVAASTTLAVRSPADRSVTVAYAAATPITTSGDIGAASIAPDGRQVALLTRDALAVQPLAPHAAPRIVLRGRPSYFTLAWSPDSRHVAVVMALADGDVAPGLLLVDVESAAVRRLGDNLGHVAFAGGDELATARFAGKHVEFYSIAAASAQLVRRCPLSGQFVGIRSLSPDPRGDGAIAQLDVSDRMSMLVHMDRTCQQRTLVSPLATLAFARDLGDGGWIAYRHSHGDLVDVARQRRHLVPGGDLVPLARTREGELVSLARLYQWQLLRVGKDGVRDDLHGGTASSTFAVATDGVTAARVDEPHGRGLLRIGALDGLSADRPIRAERVARVAWSPSGDRLAVLRSTRGVFELSLIDPVTGTESSSHAVPIRYDMGMTWIDGRRVAFVVAHEYRGFAWVDVYTGEQGTLAYGDGAATLALGRAQRSERLAFLTETPHEVRVWLGDASASLAQLRAVIAVSSPQASRRVRVAWSHDDRALHVYDAASGEHWLVGVEDGVVERAANLPIPRAGATTDVTNLFATAAGLVVETQVRGADLVIARPVP